MKISSNYDLVEGGLDILHQAFPYLRSLIGIEGIFFLHSSTLLLGAAFALVALPETRNKSLTQLEQIFVKKGKQGQEEAGCVTFNKAGSTSPGPIFFLEKLSPPTKIESRGF